MKTFGISILFLLTCLLANQAHAQIFNRLYIVMTTGSDDLRKGSLAFLQLNFSDSTYSAEIPLTNNASASGNFKPNGVLSGLFTLEGNADLSTVTGVTIRYDGSPRAGEPFSTYDNWDLKAIRINAMTRRGGPRGRTIYDSRNDSDRATFVTRFTGQARRISLPKQ